MMHISAYLPAAVTLVRHCASRAARLKVLQVHDAGPGVPWPSLRLPAQDTHIVWPSSSYLCTLMAAETVARAGVHGRLPTVLCCTSRFHGGPTEYVLIMAAVLGRLAPFRVLHGCLQGPEWLVFARCIHELRRSSIYIHERLDSISVESFSAPLLAAACGDPVPKMVIANLAGNLTPRKATLLASVTHVVRHLRCRGVVFCEPRSVMPRYNPQLGKPLALAWWPLGAIDSAPITVRASQSATNED